MKLKLTILTNDEMDVIEHDVFRFAPNREYWKKGSLTLQKSQECNNKMEVGM